jgi:uncharacterized protein YbaR (Trm112 family)
MHRKIELSINSSMKILEIGAGGAPNKLSSILVDKFLNEENALRQRGGKQIVIDRPFVKANATLLPFKEKSFDYLIASHVVEHIPIKEMNNFFSEINRVSKSGYIEAPSVLFECLLDIPEHNWIVGCKNSTVHMCKKEQKDISCLTKFFKPMFQKDPAFWKNNVLRYADLWLTGLEWKGHVDYKIHNKLDEIIDLYDQTEILDVILKISQVRIEKPISNIFKNQFKKFKNAGKKIYKSFAKTNINYASTRKDISWREVVICPLCKSKLEEKEGMLICNSCGKRFQILKGDIPNFVIEDMNK